MCAVCFGKFLSRNFGVSKFLCKFAAVKKVLYIHGFASAGSTGSATQMRNHLYPKGVQVVSPDVPIDPIEAIGFLKELVASEQPDLIVATSMGALYGEQLRPSNRSRMRVSKASTPTRKLWFGDSLALATSSSIARATSRSTMERTGCNFSKGNISSTTKC